MEDKPEEPLSDKEKLSRRYYMMQEIDSYISEYIQYCDDEQDMIALGSVLQILSKNILSTIIDSDQWAKSVYTYVDDVLDDEIQGFGKRNRGWDSSVPVEYYKGKFW